MKRLYLTIALLLLTSCADPIKSIKNEQTNNTSAVTELLFEKDGYKVYRFYDASRYVYYVVPSGQVTEIHQESCGKNCIHDVFTQTNTLSNKK
jgi:hypothetical protein